MIIILVIVWAWVAYNLLGNFAADLEELPWWRREILTCVLIVFAPIFFVEELLEILVDVIIGREEE